MTRSWRQLTPREKLLSIVTNEITWGIFVICVCAIALIILWATNHPIEWKKYKDPVHEQGFICIISGIFAFVSIIMSLVQIIQHFVHKSNKAAQKRIMRILAMVPIYAITSWISLLFFESAIYVEFIQACYEAYIIYCFLILLTKYLGGHRGVEEAITRKENIHLAFPFGYCFKPLPNVKWVWYFKVGLLQYSWITPICLGIAIVLNLANVYGNGLWKVNRGYPYITIIINISQALALYSLITFYSNLKDELKPFQPLAKFIAIKLLVFFIFWQSVVMSVLAALNVLQSTLCDPQVNAYCHGSTTGFTVEQEKILLSNGLICVEMFFFSIAHHWIFGWEQYATNEELQKLIESRSPQMTNNNNEIDE
ncbi:unnamed protein product [Rotaria sp. Silwood1]|nr:unnamed protein product [Rotaria sp. Silwood1]CAF3893271.1 unnamed protein product [Rotaria sp. Silwood1]CAF4037876.1 unnamed protein product [Rotaria sp. Silwood1]CAF4793314.1 unnamed protein product [Rotaria sp. Silwood1]CAF5071285.1 unnamed protein product [Rotaria sp. Silwood1]